MRNRDSTHYKRSLRHYLYSLSKDLEQNKADNSFCEHGGEIIYFADSNVIFPFVSPWLDSSAFKGSFQHLLQDFSGVAPNFDIHPALLMISAEYIFSSDLIGKKNVGYI